MRENTMSALKATFPVKNIEKRSIKNFEDYKWIVNNPAYKDLSPRTIKGLKKENISVALDNLAKEVYNYINSKDNSKYEKWHFETCYGFKDNVKKECGIEIEYGKAQKIVNMTMKYLYCLSDSKEYANKFKNCHMPLDSYTLEWFCDKVVPNISTPKKISITKIKENSWSNLDYGNKDTMYSYLWIQKKIKEYLNSKNNTKYRTINNDSLTPFEAEFYIWQEQKFIKFIKESEGLQMFDSNYPDFYDSELLNKCNEVITKLTNLKTKIEKNCKVN